MTSTDSLRTAPKRGLKLGFGLRDAGTLIGLLVIVGVFAALSPNFLKESKVDEVEVM